MVLVSLEENFDYVCSRKRHASNKLLLDNSMQFKSIDAAHKEKDRILVPVSGQMMVPGAAESTEGVYTFYFGKDKQGEWNIVSID